MRIQGNLNAYYYGKKYSFKAAYNWTSDLKYPAKRFMVDDGCGFWHGKIGQLVPHEFKAEIDKILHEKGIDDICFSKKTTKELSAIKHNHLKLKAKVESLLSDVREIPEKGKDKLKSLVPSDSYSLSRRTIGFKRSDND